MALALSNTLRQSSQTHIQSYNNLQARRLLQVHKS